MRKSTPKILKHAWQYNHQALEILPRPTAMRGEACCLSATRHNATVGRCFVSWVTSRSNERRRREYHSDNQ